MAEGSAAINLTDREIEENSPVSANSSIASDTLLDLDKFRQWYGRGCGEEPAWQTALLPQICRYLGLQTGWDSYTGQPIKLETGMFALKVLNDVMGAATPAPVAVPVGTGGIQFEWHLNGFDLEFYVEGPYNCELWFNDEATGEADAVSLKSNFALLSEKVARLTAPHVKYFARNGR